MAKTSQFGGRAEIEFDEGVGSFAFGKILGRGTSID